MNTIFEKLLPSRWWKKKLPLSQDQFWVAYAGTELAQTSAVLHVAQDKFVTHMQGAASNTLPSEERLRALDRAMALADFLTEVDGNFAVAKDEVKRRSAEKQAENLER